MASLSGETPWATRGRRPILTPGPSVGRPGSDLVDEGHNAMDHPPPTAVAPPSTPRIGVGLVAAALAWSWWPSLREMAVRWSGDPRYSHGFLVPIFAGYLLWTRRGVLADAQAGPRATGLGLGLIAAGSAVAMAGARYYLGWFEGVGPLASLVGLAVLAAGPRGLRWAAPAVGFLAFMVPLPFRVETALGLPLQRAATVASTYILQTLGLPAVAEGSIIQIDEVRIGVVEACNGLGMLMMFFAFAAAFALSARRSAWDRAAILLGAAPIAFLANVARISATGLLHRLAGGRAADAFYHDLAGWLMMPLALAAFALELAALSRLFVEAPPRAPAAGLAYAAAGPSRPITRRGGQR